MCDRAKQQLLALWLNVVSGKVDTHAMVDLTGYDALGEMTVSEAIAFCEAELLLL
jgi:hypothetical protein